MTRVEYVEVSLRRPAQDAALQSVIADVAALRLAMEWANTSGDQVAALRIASVVPSRSPVSDDRSSPTCSFVSVVPPTVGSPVLRMRLSGSLLTTKATGWRHPRPSPIAREHFVAAGSDRETGWVDLSGAYAAWGMGDFPEVDRLTAKAVAVFRRESDTMGLGYGLWVAALRTSDLDEAQRLSAEADALLRATGSPMGIAHNVEGRGIIAYDRDELADAAEFVAEAVELFARSGNPGCSAHALEAAAAIVGRNGRAEVATELLGAADELRRRSGVSHKPWEIRARHGDIGDRIAPLSPAPQGRAQQRKAAHPRVWSPRRARRALNDDAGVRNGSDVVRIAVSTGKATSVPTTPRAFRADRRTDRAYGAATWPETPEQFERLTGLLDSATCHLLCRAPGGGVDASAANAAQTAKRRSRLSRPGSPRRGRVCMTAIAVRRPDTARRFPSWIVRSARREIAPSGRMPSDLRTPEVPDHRSCNARSFLQSTWAREEQAANPKAWRGESSDPLGPQVPAR